MTSKLKLFRRQHAVRAARFRWARWLNLNFTLVGFGLPIYGDRQLFTRAGEV